MYVTQKLTVTPSIDPAQAEQQKQMAVMMPLFSGFLFLQWHLPSAFVLYYLIFNILSTAQQKYYMSRRHADIHGEPDVDKDGGDGDGGPAASPPRQRRQCQSAPANGDGNGGPRPAGPLPVAQAKNETPANGAKIQRGDARRQRRHRPPEGASQKEAPVRTQDSDRHQRRQHAPDPRPGAAARLSGRRRVGRPGGNPGRRTTTASPSPSPGRTPAIWSARAGSTWTPSSTCSC